MGESEKAMKVFYNSFSGATHPNQKYIPTRFLGEGNQFVLGAIGDPDLSVVADYMHNLIKLWFWFTAMISYYYRELLRSTDRKYIKDYMKLANKAKVLSEELLRSQPKLQEKEYSKLDKPAPNTVKS